MECSCYELDRRDCHTLPNLTCNIQLTWTPAAGRTHERYKGSAQVLTFQPTEGLGPTAAGLVSCATLLRADLTWGTSPATKCNTVHKLREHESSILLQWQRHIWKLNTKIHLCKTWGHVIIFHLAKTTCLQYILHDFNTIFYIKLAQQKLYIFQKAILAILWYKILAEELTAFKWPRSFLLY